MGVCKEKCMGPRQPDDLGAPLVGSDNYRQPLSMTSLLQTHKYNLTHKNVIWGADLKGGATAPK